MNKIININLGGLPFVIDDDAFEYLNNYLNAIKKHFSFSESRDEIMYDIEIRIAELFQEKLKHKQIITHSELDAVIKIMGKPEEFGGEPIEEVNSKSYQGNQRNSDYKYIKPGKRLFRDSSESVIGGVCKGISTYLGIEDPVWMRIFFAFLFFAAGTGLIFYIFLWIIIPEAKTSSDRLAMQGEPINIDNIAKKVEEGIDSISKKINEFGEDISKRSKEKNWDFSKKSHKESNHFD